MRIGVSVVIEKMKRIYIWQHHEFKYSAEDEATDQSNTYLAECSIGPSKV